MKIIACISQDWNLVPAAETPIDDKQRFAALTAGGVCVVGRKTWEELPEQMRRGSGGRSFRVATRSHDLVGGCGVKHADLDLASPAFWCIGGMEIYRATWPRATMLYLSILHREAPGSPFPQLGNEAWERIVNQHHPTHVFQIYQRR